MKKFLFTVTVGAASLAVYAQNFSLSWVKQFGGPSQQYTESVATDNSGATISGGSFEGVIDFDPGTGSQTLSSNGNRDCYISKLNADGSYAWAISFGSTLADELFDVATDAQGNVYATGEFRGTVNFNPQGTAANLTAFSGYNAFVIKFNSSGVFQWVKKFGGVSNGYESGRQITIDNAGNVISHGMFYGPVDFDPGTGVAELNPSGNYGAYISKLTSNGDFVWAKAFNGYYTTPTEIKVDASNNIFCVGFFYSNVDFDPGAGSFMLNGQYYDTYITKLTQSGDFVWAKQFTSNNYCYTNCIVFDNAGNIYAAGGFNGTTDFDPDLVATQTVTNTTYTYRPFLVKLNSNGLFQWLKQLAPNSEARVYGLALDIEQNFYIAGTFKGTSDFDPDPIGEFLMSSNGSSYTDVFISKLNAQGDFVNAWSYGGTNEDRVADIILRPSTGILTLVGDFAGTCDFDPTSGTTNLTSAGQFDGYVAKLVQCSAVSTQLQESACGSVTINGLVYTQSGTFQQTLTASTGCDSIVNIQIAILPATTSSVTLYTNDVITYNGVLYTAEGNYTQNTTNAAGCDSTIFIFVDILQSSFTPSSTSTTLSSGQQGVAYQWIDCATNQPIPGATDATYNPTQTGNYAVIVYGNSGSVTSGCVQFIYTGIEDSSALQAAVFPNPTDHVLTVSAPALQGAYLELYDLTGKLIFARQANSNTETLDLSSLPSGMYKLMIRQSNISKHVNIAKS